MERVLGLVVLAWYVVVGWRLFVLSGSRRAAAVPAVQVQEMPAKTAENKEGGRIVWREF